MCRQMIGYETAGNTPYPPLPPRRMKHLVVEMFVATKKVSLGDFDFVFFIFVDGPDLKMKLKIIKSYVSLL